jgi:hypothetical protein
MAFTVEEDERVRRIQGGFIDGIAIDDQCRRGLLSPEEAQRANQRVAQNINAALIEDGAKYERLRNGEKVAAIEDDPGYIKRIDETYGRSQISEFYSQPQSFDRMNNTAAGYLEGGGESPVAVQRAQEIAFEKMQRTREAEQVQAGLLTQEQAEAWQHARAIAAERKGLGGIYRDVFGVAPREVTAEDTAAYIEASTAEERERRVIEQARRWEEHGQVRSTAPG